MATRGRPRGVNINPVAVTDLLARVPMSKQELCAVVGISAGHFADMIHRSKGAAPETIRAMAEALRCSPETIAPALLPQFIAVRTGDPKPDAEAVA